MFNFEQAAKAADRAAAAGTLHEEMTAVYDVLKYKEEIQIALTNQALQRCAGPPPGHERLPFRDEHGDDYGRVEARIPKSLFFGLKHQKNFGEEGLYSDDGMKDVLKAFPQCRVTTISGKVTSGYGSKQPARNRVVFGRNTITFAT